MRNSLFRGFRDVLLRAARVRAGARGDDSAEDVVVVLRQISEARRVE
jgi:hypothetical protein